ncbi:MAG: NAD(P)/FAD-dependent oxidoreductase [Christensenellaceae bacterium]
MKNNIVIGGGGPAGILAAYAAGMRGISTTILEKNEKLGKKLYITGKGRCNITNDCEISDFFINIVKNNKFLMSSFYSFSNTDLLNLFKKYGLSTKTERGGRVFPVSDRSADVIRVLEKMLSDANVTIEYNADVLSVEKHEERFCITLKNGKIINSDAVIIATGGKSYPLTGSTGDGFRFAAQFSHTIEAPHPALIPLEDEYGFCPKMQGLTLKNVLFTLYQNHKKIYAEQGEMLFTHFGLSGPIVLSASSYINFDKQPLDLYAMIDFKPALSAEVLDARLIRELEANHNKQLKNVMGELLPLKIIHPFLEEIKIDANLQANQIKKEERAVLLNALKNFKIKIADTRPIEEAIITAGGVNVKQINPSTMQSKLVSNLYFAGEVLDVHAKTGGFNLQIAFSTGYLAGTSVFT